MPHEQDGAKSKQSLRFTIGAPVAKHQPQISTVDCGCNGLGIVGRTTNFLMTKEPARRDSGADGWMLGAAGAGGWSCAGRVRTVSKLKVRAGIILGPHAARTLSKLDLGMRTGTEAQSNAEEGGRAHQPRVRAPAERAVRVGRQIARAHVLSGAHVVRADREARGGPQHGTQHGTTQ